MNTTSVPTIPAPTQFADRIVAVGRRMAYAFSLDLTVALDSRPRGAGSRPCRAAMRQLEGGDPSFTYHVQDEVLVTTVDGVVRDVPRATVVRADDVLLVDAEGVGSLDGRLLLQLDADIRATISVAYTGVVTMPGGAGRIFELADREDVHGTAFISIRSECELSKFRWMVENQLFGFGRFHAHGAKTADSAWACTVDFSYDVYSAG